MRWHTCRSTRDDMRIPAELGVRNGAVFEEKHSAAVHAEIRADTLLWKALPLVGFQQHDPSDPDDVIELRNCTCGSTLGKKNKEVRMRFEVYRDKGGAYRWRLLATNGAIIADSGEGYTRCEDAHRAIGALLKGLTDVVIVDA